VPQYVPRRIGEILRPPVLVGAALGGVLSLWWLRRRAVPGAVAGVLARGRVRRRRRRRAADQHALRVPHAAILSRVLRRGACSAGRAWSPAERAPALVERRRGALVLVVLVAFTPSQVKSAHRELGKLSNQQSIQNDLLALVDDGAVNLRCGPVGVPNHAPVPLIALYLHASPTRIVSAAEPARSRAAKYVDPASRFVEDEYVLDPHDPHRPVSVPPGFVESRARIARG